MDIVLVLAVWIVSAAITGLIANWAGDEPSGPFMLGLLTGPLGVILALILVRPWDSAARAR